MEDNVLYIKYDRGSMAINMDVFFPSSKAAFKKLLKVVDMDWGSDLQHREKLKSYFQEKVSECQEQFELNRKEYWKYEQLAADTKRMVLERKRPNGVPLTKDELKVERDRATTYKLTANNKMRSAKDYERRKKKFQELLTLL